MSFSRKIANDSTGTLYHRAIYFMPKAGTTNKQIIEKLTKEGIASYCQPDRVNADGYTVFDDGKFDQGYLRIITNASCCAFTRAAGYFYLFPIHRAELKSVGLTEDDLLLWIKKFNDQKIGYEYLYFGEQPAPAITEEGQFFFWKKYHSSEIKDNTFYWVGVPIFDQTNILKPYLHWVTLRYLWNNRTSAVNMALLLPSVQRLSYYNIPRITMMLHEDYNIPFLRAFLYAHVAHPWSYANSLAYSDYLGISGVNQYGEKFDFNSGGQQGPCLNITKPQFKAWWEFYGNSSQQSCLNGMLTQYKYNYFMNSGEAVKNLVLKTGVKSLHAPYDGRKVVELFNKCDYEGFINEIKSSYRPKKTIRQIVKKEVKKNEKISA
jgi:hypothetical protein